jgi:hypothetical protein
MLLTVKKLQDYKMKYIITEQQMRTMTKRFKKDDVDRGELGPAIEELVLNFFENTFLKSPVCDLVAIKHPKTSEYIVLILTPTFQGNQIESRIARYIENFIGVNPMVMVNQSQNCDK